MIAFAVIHKINEPSFASDNSSAAATGNTLLRNENISDKKEYGDGNDPNKIALHMHFYILVHNFFCFLCKLHS